MAERILGIDAGSTMTKAALFDAEGVEYGCERRRNPILFPAPGHTERDPDRMWDDAADAVRTLLAATGTDPKDIAAVSCSGYGCGLYLVDREGNPVRPGVMSTDGRAAGHIARWERAGIAEVNGQRIQQRLWAGQSGPIMAWLAENEPEAVARTHAVIFCKDFVRGRLAGEISTDPTDAGIAGLIDITRGDYARDMFRDIGLDAFLDRLPEIGPSTEVVGRVTAAAAAATGLAEGTPVVRGAVDVTASALASGVAVPAQMSIVAGTFSINSTLHDAPRTSRLPVLQCAYPVGGRYIATEASATSASNLEWFCKTILGAEADRALAAGRSIYDVSNDLVAGALGRRNDILFLPFLFGGPGGAPAALIGAKASDDLGDVLRAIYEGIAFSHADDIDALLDGPDAARPTSIRLAGGASRSAVWSQFFADLLDLPVETTAGSELGALGVSMCAAVALGHHADLAAAQGRMVRVARRFEPNPVRRRELAAKRARYQATVAALAHVNAGCTR